MAMIDFPGLAAIDMTAFDLSFLSGATLVTAKATTLQWNFGPNQLFTISGSGMVPVVVNGVVTEVTAGTVTAVVSTNAGVVQQEAHGLQVSAVKMSQDINSGHWAAWTQLVLSGSDHITGTSGNDVLLGGGRADNLQAGGGADHVTGGSGADRIDGGLGNDWLTGGAGADSFVFDTHLSGATNTDKITDFTHGTDHIDLGHAIFTGIGSSGALSAADFALGAATTASQHILYDAGTGNLSYDKDGVGGLAAITFAHVTPGLTVTASDFLII